MGSDKIGLGAVIMIGWLNEVFAEVPFLSTYLLAIFSIVVGSITFTKWGNIKASVSVGLLLFVMLGAVFMSFGWISSLPVITALVALGLVQLIL